jgi:hypothetical protein
VLSKQAATVSFEQNWFVIDMIFNSAVNQLQIQPPYQEAYGQAQGVALFHGPLGLH